MVEPYRTSAIKTFLMRWRPGKEPLIARILLTSDMQSRAGHVDEHD